ncbi:ABC transporter substrate-binding protein [Myceligenerans salitolerans]|uniref:Carbohydrate ABC transporter substrate-binding protein n=1 Tax=Myceligenerans salitolerans TaxID=1230528 RepID=A0ABS3IA54_9MICO|nr:ABC transporter substrate-binding protein [Myceligenerans salitolerans]MBO0609910.1 carbohydrate ABC transporter substrate-binding protein [Myceligenerans salitolerans]
MRFIRPFRRTVVTAAGVAAATLVLAGCGGTSQGDSGESGPITLTVATFNDFGYTDELFARYTQEHPDITIEPIDAASADDARTNLTTKLAAGGEGLADIEAIEVDWISELAQYPDLFTDLADPELEGRWVDWKVQQATTADGKLIGYGTDIGPEAICYRQDLLEDAGLPSEPEAVAELLGGEDATWEEYFAAGAEFVENSDAAWYDSGVATYQGLVNQVEHAYENEDGTPKPLADNTEIKELYDTVLEQHEAGLSADLVQWSDDWATAFQKDAFATMLCPAWMTGTIEQNSGGVDGWNIADVFPGGGGNWGGSFLTVPAAGEHTEAARELAAWLTAPEQQTAAFEEAGNFPSQVEAQASEQVQSYVNEFMNDAPAGRIFSNRAQAIDGNPFKGPNYFAIHQTVQQGIERVETTGEDPVTSWEKTLAAFDALGL